MIIFGLKFVKITNLTICQRAFKTLFFEKQIKTEYELKKLILS